MKKRFILFAIMLLTLIGGGRFNVLNAQEVTSVTIDDTKIDGGTASTERYTPLATNYKTSTSQFFYMADEINKPDGGIITHLTFYNNSHAYTTTDRNISVYIKETTDSNFGSNSRKPVPMSNSDLCYSGSITLKKSAGNPAEIELNPPFSYSGNGKNLLICIDDNTNVDWGKDVYFVTINSPYKEIATDTYGYRSIYYRNNTTTYDPTSEDFKSLGNTTFTASKHTPKITFTFSSGGNEEPETPTLPTPEINKGNLYTAPQGFGLSGNGYFFPEFYSYVKNATHYKMLVATNEACTENVKYIAGNENDWVEISGGATETEQQIKATSDIDLQYSVSTKYYWQVIAKNGNDTITATETFNFNTKALTSAPTAATLSSPTDEEKTTVNPLLEWTLGDYTEEYSVYLGTSPDSLEEVKHYSYITRDEYKNSAASYQTSGLETGTYYWQIKTRNDADESSSEVRSFTKVGRPDNVTQLSPATGVTSSIIEWQFAENTTAYRILINDGGFAYVGDSKGGKWIETKGATTASYDLGELTPNKTYEWCIDVKNDAGSRAYWDNSEDVTIFTSTAASTLPVSYTTPAEGATGLDNPELSWTYKGKAVSYQVYLGTDANDLQAMTEVLPRSEVATGLNSEDSYQTDSLEVATKYYWRVDVQDSVGNVYQGAVRSFVSTFPAITNADSDKTQVYPTDPKVTIYWSGMNKATKYEVYKDGELIGETVNTQYQATGLTYNKEGYNFTVVAVYEYGKSAPSNVVNVKVTGYGTYKLTVTDNNTVNAVAGAKVALTGTDEFGNERTYSNDAYTTNENGVCTISNILVGTYTATVTKANYDAISIEGIQINYGVETAGNAIMTSEFYFNVTLGNITKDEITIYLDGTSQGYYDIYVVCDDTPINTIANCWFQPVVPNDPSYVKYTYDWSHYGNGSYTFSVSKAGSDVANTADQQAVRNYDIAEVTGAWTDENTWRDEVPGEDGDVYINGGALVTIGVEDNITVKNLTIESGGQLTINGSLTVTGKMTNGNGVSGLILNDGCQLRQSSDNLDAQFVMNIKNPTDWTGDNKDGWQFISVPFKGEAEIEEFTNGVEYDLYRYNGSNVGEEWINQKDESNEFETEFTLQKGYLVSYATAGTFTSTGIVNNATTIATQYSYDSENEMKNFHLIGNPFTFNMDMSKLNLFNMVQGYAVLNEAGSGYEYLPLEGEVKVGDAFFVKATGDYPTATYGAAAASRGKASESVSIIATSKAGKDNVVINFAGKSEGFNKLQNFNDELATVYVVEDGKNYGIYNCDADVKEVMVAFEAKKMDNYTISAQPNGEFESIILVDRATGIETNLLVEDYNFTATPQESFNRFIVKLSAKGQEPESGVSFAYYNGEELIVNAEGSIQIVDMMGRVVYQGEMTGENNRVDVSGFNSSAYIIRLVNDNNVKTQKVVIY